MANRNFRNAQYTLEQDVVKLYGSFNVGAAGAVSSFQGGGIASVVKETADGQYTITLTDNYQRLLMFQAVDSLGSASDVAKVQIFEAPATLQSSFVSGAAFTVQCLDYAGAAVNPDSGVRILFSLEVRNSTVGPFDA